MTDPTQRRNRSTRHHAAVTPHRIEDRFYAVRSTARNRIADLERALNHHPIGTAATRDVRDALRRVEHAVTSVPVSADTGALDRSIAVIDHLEGAIVALGGARRVSARLGEGHRGLHDALDAAGDLVLWHVRADRLDGRLTAAVAALRDVVEEAETAAARR